MVLAEPPDAPEAGHASPLLTASSLRAIQKHMTTKNSSSSTTGRLPYSLLALARVVIMGLSKIGRVLNTCCAISRAPTGGRGRLAYKGACLPIKLIFRATDTLFCTYRSLLIIHRPLAFGVPLAVLRNRGARALARMPGEDPCLRATYCSIRRQLSGFHVEEMAGGSGGGFSSLPWPAAVSPGGSHAGFSFSFWHSPSLLNLLEFEVPRLAHCCLPPITPQTSACFPRSLVPS